MIWFNLVAVNRYRDESNDTTYVQKLRAHAASPRRPPAPTNSPVKGLNMAPTAAAGYQGLFDSTRILTRGGPTHLTLWRLRRSPGGTESTYAVPCSSRTRHGDLRTYEEEWKRRMYRSWL